MEPKCLDKIQLHERFKKISRGDLARSLGSSRNTIDQIAGGHIIVSAKRAKEIERLTLGKVPAVILRPDIFA